MRGVYESTYEVTGVNAALTLMYLTSPSGKVVEILGASVTVLGTSDLEIECALEKISSLGAPTATTVTPSPMETGDAAAGSTVKAKVTASEPTYGGKQYGRSHQPGRAGWIFQASQSAGDRPMVNHTESIGLKLISGISGASYTLLVTLKHREIG